MEADLGSVIAEVRVASAVNGLVPLVYDPSGRQQQTRYLRSQLILRIRLRETLDVHRFALRKVPVPKGGGVDLQHRLASRS